MRTLTRAVVAAATLLLLAVPFATVSADWWLWESPNENTELLDQSQITITQYNPMQGGHGVGQSFIPQQPLLYRMDFLAASAWDQRPFRIRLWSWIDGNGNGEADEAEYAATVAQSPIWEDQAVLPGPDKQTLLTFYPDLVVTPGVSYYLEFFNDTADGEFHLYSAWGPADPYADGSARVNNHFVKDPDEPRYADLYFRTYAGPQGAPAPLLCGDSTDEAPCFSAPAAWEEPSPPGPPVTANDYREIVESKADDGRGWALNGDGKGSTYAAMWDAFLYRVTSDASYVDNVVTMFERSVLWRLGHLQDTIPFTWMTRPGWAYRWVRESPAVSPDDHEMMKKLMLFSASRVWPDRELGLHNHTLGYALTMKMVTDLIPAGEFVSLSACIPGPEESCVGLFQEGDELDAQDHADWESYADDVWNEFKADWELTTDASRYQYFDLQYLLQLALLYDEMDLIWSAPGFRLLIERLYEIHLPLGPFAVFGDTNGWAQAWGSPVWVFEEAAARWQDPKYKWLAWRIFDHHRTHIKYPIEPWRAVAEEYVSFCHAYFAVDPNVPALPPPERTERIEAAQDQVQTFDWQAGSDGLGQTFVAGASPLVGIELRVHNAGNAAPAEVRLWKWNQDHATTTGQPPLYADTLFLDGAETFTNRRLQPFLQVQPGQIYFLEVRRDPPFRVKGAAGQNAYADGELWWAGAAVPAADLWFRTHSLTDDGAKVTHRLEVFTSRPSQAGFPPRTQLFGTQQVPEKLILRSGYGIEDLHAVVNLVGTQFTHGQAETGSILSLAHKGSVLLVDSYYHERLAKDQNRALTRRYQGGTPVAEVAPVSIPLLDDAREVTVAHVDWGDRWLWDIQHQRRLFFIKNRFLLVRDRTAFDSTTTAATGSVWHGWDVHPDHGFNWYALYDREPVGKLGWLFKNPEQYLLLYMVDRPGIDFAEWEVERNGSTGTPASAPYVVSQKYVTTAFPGTTLWTDSLLLPFGPERMPGDAASAISVVHDDGANVALKIEVDDEIWTLVDNPDETTLDAGGVVTDASYLVTRTSAGGPSYVLTRDASQVEVDDGPGRRIRLEWPVRSSVELQDSSTVQDFDADGIPDAVDLDTDGDAVPDALDADPTNAFVCRDADGDTCDDCSSGTDDPYSDGPDADVDGICDAQDNCVFAPNPTQGDADDDTEGDHCDLDDGLTYLVLISATGIAWQEEVATQSWNLYRGDLELLRSTGEYTQLPGSTVLAQRWCDLAQGSFQDLTDPQPAEVAFYLATGVTAGVEGAPGTDSSGADRPNLHPCPD